jgi:hypothetical protein
MQPNAPDTAEILINPNTYLVFKQTGAPQGDGVPETVIGG